MKKIKLIFLHLMFLQVLSSQEFIKLVQDMNNVSTLTYNKYLGSVNENLLFYYSTPSNSFIGVGGISEIDNSVSFIKNAPFTGAWSTINSIVFNNQLYFTHLAYSACVDMDEPKYMISELWKTDGSKEGLDSIMELSYFDCTDPPEFYNFSDNFFIIIKPDTINGNELWKSDGTAN